MAILGIIVGLAGGFGAIGFRYLIDFCQSISYGSAGELLDVVSPIPWYFRIGIPALGGLVVGPIVYFLAREAKGHGVPEVMEAVAMKYGIIRKRIVIIKSLVSAICIGTGGSVGREGPIVQIGSAVGSTLGQMFKVSENRMKTLVGCGAAVGIAATFNAPIAGFMFALEIILGEFGVANLTGVLSFLDYNTAVFNSDLQDLVVVKDLATQDVVTVSVDDNICNALEKITSKDFSILPVVAPDDHLQLLGVLTRKDILDAYDRTVIKKSMTYE
jgi:CIC family chloride channel protein